MVSLYGLITGVLFGFLLQKGRVARYDMQVGAMRFIDMTVFKFMLSAIAVAMVGLHILADLGQVAFSVKAVNLGANIVGGLLFGVGWAVGGYCPGTSAAALGEGRYDALWLILGGLVGTALYAEVYPAMQSTVLAWGDFGKLTLPQFLGVTHWVIVPLFVAAVLCLFLWFERLQV